MSGTALLVHDDIAAIAAARRVLVAEGLEVVLATSSADAIIAFGQQPLALVVLAPAVDGGRGGSVYSEIRSLPQGEHVRFILLGAAIPDARETLTVELPLQADAFRAAVHRALAVEGAGWELEGRPAQITSDAPSRASLGLEDPEPWRNADPRAALGGEPLAEALFGDLRAVDAGSRPPTEAQPITGLAAPAVAQTAEFAALPPEPDAVPPELAALPLSHDDAPARPHTEADAPTLDRAFEELELPPEEIEKAARARELAERKEAERREAERDRNAVREKLAQLRATIAQDESAAERTQARIAQLRAERESLEAKLQIEQRANQAAADQAQSQAAEVEQLEHELARLAGELASVQHAREAAERQAAALGERQAVLSERNTDLQARLASETSQLQELEQLREQAESRVRAEAEAAKAAGRSADGHAAQLELRKDKLREIEARAQQQAAARAAAEQRVAALEAELSGVERAVQQAQARAEAEEAQISGLQARQEELEAERAEKEQLRADAERRAKDLQAQRAELQAAAQQATQKAKTEAERVTTLDRAREAAEIKLAQASRAAERAQAEVESLTQKRQQAEAERERLREELAERAALQKSAEASENAASKELQKVERAVAKLRQELEALDADRAQSEKAEAQARLDAAHAERDRLEAELEQTSKERETAQAEAAQADAAAEKLQTELRELAVRLKAETAERDQSQADLRAHIEGMEKAKVDLNAELEQLRGEAEQTAAQMDSLGERKAQLEAELQALEAERETARAKAQALADKRDAFLRAVAEAESGIAALKTEPRPAEQTDPSIDLARELPRPRKLRPFAGGRFKRPQAKLEPDAPAPQTVDPTAPPLTEGPVQARPPLFAERGDLEELGAAGFFARVWQERVTGRFDIELRDGTRALYFEEGRLAAALSSAPYDRLEALAQREGLITRAQERVLRQESADIAPRQMAVRMVELQLIKGTELYDLVRRHLEQVAYALFAEERGPYIYTPELAPAEHRVALPVHPLAFMLEGVRRKADFERLDRLLGGPSALVRRLAGKSEASELGLTARERRFFELIDGLRTIEELVFASGLETASALKLLHGLAAAELVEVIPGEPVEDAAAPAAKIDLARVREKYEQVHSGDYFEILGVEREATSYEVQAAFERLSREFQPARYAGLGGPELAAQLQEIARIAAEAADVLADDRTRRAYALNLAQAG